MIYYAGDVGIELDFPMLTGDVDGSSITSARLLALPPSGGRRIELAASIDDATTESITILHVTDGGLNRPGSWVLRAFFYSGSALVLSSLETTIEVTPRRVGPPQ